MFKKEVDVIRIFVTYKTRDSQQNLWTKNLIYVDDSQKHGELKEPILFQYLQQISQIVQKRRILVNDLK